MTADPRSLRIARRVYLAGDTDPPGSHPDQDNWIAAIDTYGHGGVIECYGLREAEARDLRDKVLQGFEDTKRLNWLLERAAAHSKGGGLVLNESMLKASLAFHTWGKTAQEVKDLIDKEMER